MAPTSVPTPPVPPTDPRPIARHGAAALLLMIAMLALGACGGDDAAAGAEDAGAATSGEIAEQAATPVTGAEVRGGDEVEVVLTGGPNAGTHRTPVDLFCLGADGKWTVGTGSMSHLPSGIGEIGAGLEGVPASGGSTEQVDFVVLFGEPDQTDPTRGMTGIGGIFGGSGRGTVERQGESAVIRVEGTAGDGTGVTATFRCTMATTA